MVKNFSKLEEILLRCERLSRFGGEKCGLVAYAPFLWVEVVGTRAQVVEKAERMSLIACYDIAAWHIRGEYERFATKIGKCFFE